MVRLIKNQFRAHGLIFISDLHLSLGYDSATGSFDPRENFYNDQAFADFLTFLRHSDNGSGPRWRLVILGDLFDFLNVSLESTSQAYPKLDTSNSSTRVKLERIVKGHSLFFDALRDFLNAGYSLDIVVGNHDIELIRESTQKHFNHLLFKDTGQDTEAGRVHFYPWIYYVPGVVYAEHGHQYHDINRFANLLQPYRKANMDDIDLPIGSFFHVYLLNLIETLDPHSTRVRPSIRAVYHALLNRPFRGGFTVKHHWWFLQTFIRLMFSAITIGRRQRADHQYEHIQAYANDLGLRYEMVKAIDQLSIASPQAIVYRLLRKLAQSCRCHLVRSSQAKQHVQGYLFRTARSIHELLEAENKSTTFYIFGHTHKPEQIRLSEDAGTPCYFNTGTWTTNATSTAEEAVQLPFIEIVGIPNTGTYRARLLYWNGEGAQSEA